MHIDLISDTVTRPSPGTVSYTHLDVYKRQIQNWGYTNKENIKNMISQTYYFNLPTNAIFIFISSLSEICTIFLLAGVLNQAVTLNFFAWDQVDILEAGTGIVNL